MKQSTSGLTDTYRITLADTTTFDFTVKNGRGISTIAKVSVSGLVDTYRITYNDNTTSTFTITNGAKGDKGDTGADGKDGAASSGINGAKIDANGNLILTLADGTTIDAGLVRDTSAPEPTEPPAASVDSTPSADPLTVASACIAVVSLLGFIIPIGVLLLKIRRH